MDTKPKRSGVQTTPGGNMVGFQTKPSTPFTSRFENSDVDHRLRQKFQFFLQDLIRNATIANTVLPINVLDDRGTAISIQNFLKRSGPKYIFQFIQTNAENSPLVRSGFSLITVCLSYLRRLQLEFNNDEGASGGGMDSKYHYIATPQAHNNALTNLQQKTAINHFLEEKAWVSQAISKINDSISVSSCMSIFVTTHDALAQELILNCVMNLMFASEDSVVQMLTPPAVFNKSNRALDEKEKQQLLNGTKRPHSRAATSETMMSKNSGHPFGASSNNLSAYNVEAAKASFRGDNPGSRNRVSSSFTEVQNGNINNNSTNDGSTNNGLSATGNNDERRASATVNNHMSASGKIEDGWMDPSQHNCLSYMLAVAVLQKNRHSLLAAAAEVIIVMAKDASQGLCESIARANTCPLPLLSAVTSLSSNGGRRSRASGSSSMRKMSGSYDDETMLMPINPLTAGKVIDWAGIKIFLKFLHRYHSLMSSKDVFMDLLQQQHQLLVYENPHEDKNMLTAMAMNNLTGLRASLTNGAVSRMSSPLMGGSMTAGAEEGELITSSKMLSEELQREFLAVHDRVFVALCFLIKGSPTAIAPFLLSLPGALDILRLSSIIFQERKQDHSHMAGYDMVSAQSSVSSMHHHQGTASSPTEEMEDAAVNIAMNTLQLEKQRMSRRHRGPVAFNGTLSSNTSVMSLDHMIYSATGGVVPSSGQNSLGHKLGLAINLNETGSLSTGSGPATGNRTAGNTSRGQSAPNPLARGFGNVKNQGPAHRKRVNTANTSSSVHGKKLQPLGPPITLSPGKIETLSTPVTLAAADNHHKPPNIRPFEAPIPIQTETKSLYKQNQLNRQQVASAPASDLQYLAVNRIVHTAQAPLHAPQSMDSLLDTSLQIIDREAKESVIHGQPQKERLLMPAPAPTTAAGRHPLLTDSVLNFDPSASSTMQASHSQGPFNASTSASQSNLLLPRPSTSSPTRLGSTTGMAATRDFFGALPTKPVIPKRIEAQDAIIPGESMEIIRRKFQQIANGALNQIKSSGSVFNNGKNAMSLTERARRVYSPKRAGSSTASGSGGASSPTTRDSSPGGKAAAPTKKQSSGLQPLSFLDETGGNEDSDDDDEGDSWANRRRRATRQSTDSPTAAAVAGEGSDMDPEKTPAWNPRPEGLAYYGIRLDNVEFEEQDLFEHFKPIFGYEEHHDNVGEAKAKTNNADLYEQQQNPHGAFHATRGKIAGELEQTGDLLLL